MLKCSTLLHVRALRSHVACLYTATRNHKIVQTDMHIPDGRIPQREMVEIKMMPRERYYRFDSG